jgi:Fur family ferric uptake transcriptional regulator
MTKQRKILLQFLSEHADESLFAEQIALALKEEGISVSAIYRNLADLEKEGKVRRTSKDGSRKVFFQYIGGEECRACIHLSCKKCGKTYHMDMSEADILIHHVAKQEKFAVDRSQTVLYGICGDCQDHERRND